MTALTPDILLRAYAAGVFPMSESRDDPEVFWVDPRRRGVIPLDGFHISRSLAKRMRRTTWTLSVDQDFAGVVRGCAARPSTWINDTIFDLYSALHDRGQAHSVELWEGAELIGGVYGVRLGGAFFGESMFSARVDASKIALAALIDRLRVGGFTLFDTQFTTPHLERMGAVEIPRAEYRTQLDAALSLDAAFHALGETTPQAVVQRNTQTS